MRKMKRYVIFGTNLSTGLFHDSIGSHQGFAQGVNILKKGRLQEVSLRTLAYALVCQKY